jgi:microcystin-dependent protein
MMVCAALLSTLSVEARAQNNYIGQLLPVAFNFCPQHSVPAEGQQIQINQNQALYSVIGDAYGGNRMTYFQLPDLRGRVPIGKGQAPDMDEVGWGQVGGTQHQQIDLPPKSADAKPVDIQGTPYLAITWCIVIEGVYPTRER